MQDALSGFGNVVASGKQPTCRERRGSLHEVHVRLASATDGAGSFAEYWRDCTHASSSWSVVEMGVLPERQS